VPVVSVGNLTFGGTGKTPTVIALVRELVRRGRRPAVLTRGYGRRGTVPTVVVGPEPKVSADLLGDEPLEMAARLPGVPIVIDADRVRGGSEAVRMGANILVMDDGFQHLRLARDLNLVLLDAGDPWGGERLPPKGRLREPLAALVRASAVLVTKVPLGGDGVVEEISRRVNQLASDIPVLAARMKVSRVRQPDGWRGADVLADIRVLAFSGIGRPQAFADLAADAGAQLVTSLWFPDHHRYSTADIDRVVAAAADHGATPVTTAKDAVKLPPDAPVWVVEADMVPVDGSWEELWHLLPGERT
jgi:tetraacyldisaccharide 4'-kinase